MRLPTKFSGSAQLLDNPVKINRAMLLNVTAEKTVGYKDAENFKF